MKDEIIEPLVESISVEKKKNKVENKLKEYEALSNREKYNKLDKELDNLIIDINGEDIDVILDYTSSIFFKLCFKLNGDNIDNMLNKLSKLYHKLKNLHFFNQLVSLHRKIKNISYELNDKYSNFISDKDMILESIYDYDKNKNAEYKSLGLNIKSTDNKKYELLSNVLEEKIYSRDDDIYSTFDLILDDYDEGNTLTTKFNDKYIIINTSINDMIEVLKKYGIESVSWYDIYDAGKKRTVHRSVGEMTEEERKKIDEDRKKEEEDNKLKEQNLKKSLINEENFIRLKFQRTKKNTKIYKRIFFNLKKFLLSNESIKNQLIDILPYGSVTQCTCNEKSDLEMTLITKNYKNATKEYISKLFEEIQEMIKSNENGEFQLHLEGIRETKRTILLLLRDKETKIEIEINCNNFFSVMNSNLIRNYLVYDARALILINTIKDWSKIKNINSNNKHYLSSYCYTLMTIYFLQKMKEPLLPVITSYNNLINMKVNEKEFFLERQLLHSSELMQKWNTLNKSDTVTTLLIKWMIFYLYLFNETQYCIDISNKKFTFRYNEAKYLTSSIKENRLSAYCLIDMFDYTYNPGSYMGMGTTEHDTFKDVLKESIEQLLEGKKEFFYSRTEP